MPQWNQEGAISRISGALAGADISGSRNRFVKEGATADQHVAIAAATDIPSGVLLDKPNAAGKPADIACFGEVVMVEAGAAVAYGALIQTDASGRAITAVATGYVVGRARAAASGAGELIPCHINTVNPWLKA